ncbi:MAG: DUF1822 family protein [Cyanobacteria bacterium J06576_12]
MTRLPVSDFTLLDSDTVELTPEDFSTVQQTLDWAAGESHRWSRYIQGLALAGFSQWLQEQQLGFSFDQSECTLAQLQYANWLTAVSNLTFGDFKLCLLVTESLSSGTIYMPRAAVEMAEFAAHMYVLVEVEEEEGSVIIQGLLRHDDWQRYYQSAQPVPMQDWTYAVPLSLFESDPCRMGFYARYLDPAAIALPQTRPQTRPQSPAQSTTASTTEAMSALDISQELWKQLSWEQASSILASFNQPIQQSRSVAQRDTGQAQSASYSLRSIAQDVSQAVVNAAQWLDSGLDELAESVGFFSAERLQLAQGMRSAMTIEDAIHNLRRNGVPIPPELSPVYQDVEMADRDFRLCVLPYATESGDSEWSLLVILGTQTADYLPEGLELRISKGTQLLESYTLEFEEALVYSLADANFGESLQVTITAPNGDNYALPLLTFIYEGV